MGYGIEIHEKIGSESVTLIRQYKHSMVSALIMQHIYEILSIRMKIFYS